MTDLEDAVTAVLDAEEFDVLEFFAGAVLPTKDVTLYRDAAAGFALAEILDAEAEAKKKNKSEGLGLGDDDGYVDEDRITELHERLLASAATFHLKAIDPEVQRELREELRLKHKVRTGAPTSEDFNVEYNYAVIAKTIQSVTAANGKVDTKEWTVERVEKFDRKVLSTEFERLFEAVFEINFIGDSIDKAVNADF